MDELMGGIAIVDLAGKEGDFGGMGLFEPGLVTSRGRLWFTAAGRTDTPGIAIRAVNLSGKSASSPPARDGSGFAMCPETAVSSCRERRAVHHPFRRRVSSVSVTFPGRTSRMCLPVRRRENAALRLRCRCAPHDQGVGVSPRHGRRAGRAPG
jgi:hypothetical protein